MSETSKWQAGAASDAGRMRSENQDRSYVDEERGIFLVVDGLGGHAAGGIAADTALDAIRAELLSLDGDVPNSVRNAIAAANNRICDAAESNEEWRGMACVLTLAVMDGERVVAGHVGDSRLYLIWNGTIRKLTSDHSPVGELEDSGNSPKRKRWRILNGMKYFAMWVRELANFRTMISLNLSRFASKPARHCYFARTV